MAKRKGGWCKIWSDEEILSLKTSNEVMQAILENPWKASNGKICLYKRELALKEREEKYGHGGNILLYLLDKKKE